MDEHVNCNEVITRLQAERQDLQIDLRNCRALSEQRADALARLDAPEQDRRRAWAQQILRHADDLDWGPSQIAAYVAGIASEVHDA